MSRSSSDGVTRPSPSVSSKRCEEAVLARRANPSTNPDPVPDPALTATATPTPSPTPTPTPNPDPAIGGMDSAVHGARAGPGGFAASNGYTTKALTLPLLALARR